MWITHKDQSPINLDHCKTILKGTELQGNEKYYTIEFRDTGIRWRFDSENERNEEYSRVLDRLTKPLYVIPPSNITDEQWAEGYNRHKYGDAGKLLQIKIGEPPGDSKCSSCVNKCKILNMKIDSCNKYKEIK